MPKLYLSGLKFSKKILNSQNLIRFFCTSLIELVIPLSRKNNIMFLDHHFEEFINHISKIHIFIYTNIFNK